MAITVDAPKQYGSLTWPNNDMAKLLPVPESDRGKVELESSDGLVIYAADTPTEKYQSYVNECQDRGFNVNYKRGEDYFNAENADGYHLSVRYKSFHTMVIKIDKPKEEETEAETEAEPETEPEPVSDTAAADNTEAEDSPSPDTVKDAAAVLVGIRPEFKEAMDSYEAFFDEYCAFMKKYYESDDMLGMMGDYLNYLEKYNEAMDKLDKLGESEMSDAELAYYTETMLRINKKLMSVY